MKPAYKYFGGKASVADEVWRRFGRVGSYIEPFAGGLAVLLANRHPAKIEYVNDWDCFVSNFWRAVAGEPEELAKLSSYPSVEADLISRSNYLVDHREALRKKVLGDPNYYSLKIAAWWVWGQAQWLGSGFAATKVNAKLPESHPSRFAREGDELRSHFRALAKRMKSVRVECGDWERVCTISDKCLEQPVGYFLDPPYADYAHYYSADNADDSLHSRLLTWAIKRGQSKHARIALCGYEGNYTLPDDWSIFEWQATGGYGNMADGAGRKNKRRERIWFSPHCNNGGFASLL